MGHGEGYQGEGVLMGQENSPGHGVGKVTLSNGIGTQTCPKTGGLWSLGGKADGDAGEKLEGYELPVASRDCGY